MTANVIAGYGFIIPWGQTFDGRRFASEIRQIFSMENPNNRQVAEYVEQHVSTITSTPRGCTINFK